MLPIAFHGVPGGHVFGPIHDALVMAVAVLVAAGAAAVVGAILFRVARKRLDSSGPPGGRGNR